MLKFVAIFCLGDDQTIKLNNFLYGTNNEIVKKNLLSHTFGSTLTTALCQHPATFAYYHELHLPHDPPLHPVFAHPPPTQFTCAGRPRGYYADVDSGCQAYHFCWRQHLVSTDLCGNGTLFNEQFQVCDHFYNVRCGSPYEDL